MSDPREAIVVRVRDAEGGRELRAGVQVLGGDLVIAVGGGDRPHVGCVVLAVPNRGRTQPTLSVLTIPPHKEEPIARSVAETVCRRLKTAVVVTAGIHEDGIDPDGIGAYLRLGDELGPAILRRLEETG